MSQDLLLIPVEGKPAESSLVGQVYVGLIGLDGEEITDYCGHRKPVRVDPRQKVKQYNVYELTDDVVIVGSFASFEKKKGTPLKDYEQITRQSAYPWGSPGYVEGSNSVTLGYDEGYTHTMATILWRVLLEEAGQTYTILGEHKTTVSVDLYWTAYEDDPVDTEWEKTIVSVPLAPFTSTGNGVRRATLKHILDCAPVVMHDWEHVTAFWNDIVLFSIDRHEYATVQWRNERDDFIAAS